MAPTAPPMAAPMRNATGCRSFAMRIPPTNCRGVYWYAYHLSPALIPNATLARRSFNGAFGPGGNLRRVSLFGEQRAEAPCSLLVAHAIDPSVNEVISDMVSEDVGSKEGIGDEAQSLPCLCLRRESEPS